MFANNPDFTLSRAATDDALALKGLVAAAFASHAPALGRTPRPMLADYGLAVLAHQVWLVRRGDELIAALDLAPGARHLAVQTLAVRPDHQRRGLGRALLRLAEQEGRRHGYPQLRLQAPHVMAESLRLFESSGYRETRRQSYWNSQVIHLEKPL